MRLMALGAGAICLALLLGCSGTAAPSGTASTNVAATSVPQRVPPPLEAENDRICKKLYAVPCHAIAHLPGPMNAKSIGESRACVNEGIAKLESGQWVPDNKYQDPRTGERYGDACIAVSL